MPMLGQRLKGFKRDDRRHHRRTPVRLAATVMDHPGTVTDIGLGGFGFSCETLRVSVGSHVVAKIRMEDGALIETAGKVVNIGTLIGVPHFGIAFQELSQGTFRAIEQLQARRLRRRRW